MLKYKLHGYQVDGTSAFSRRKRLQEFGRKQTPVCERTFGSGGKTDAAFPRRFRTGPGIVPSTVPQDATHVVLVLNGRAPEKVAAARTWLDALPGFRKLRGVAVVLLGSEACTGNAWLLPYLRSRGGPVAAAFVVYDTALVDDAEVFQWPLGVAT